MKRAAFLDLQGTLGGSGFDDINSFAFYPFSIQAIKLLNDFGILAIGVTNQSHISTGQLTMAEYDAKIELIKKELLENGAHFDAVYCCPHAEGDQCRCRKPMTGMIDSARKSFDIDVKNSFVIGDMGKSDMNLAKNIGSKAILVLTGVGKGSLGEFRDTWCDVTPDYIADHVLTAVQWIIGQDIADEDRSCLSDHSK